MFDTQEVFDYAIQKIYEYVPGSKKRYSDKFNFRCPICGDSRKSKIKKRAWVYRGNLTELPSFYCYNECGHIGIFKFLAKIENCAEVEIKKRLFKKNVKFNPSASLSKKTVEPLKEEIALRDSWVDIQENKTAWELIENRKILEAPYLPKGWKLFFDREKNRIVIPFFKDGKMVYFQWRRIFDKDDPKYLFPEDTRKSIHGLDAIDNNFHYIFLTEGIFDAIFVKNCVCVGGVNITPYQQSLLEPYTSIGFKLVWLLNNQRKDITAMKKYLEKTEDRYSSFHFFLWPKDIVEKDVNDFIIKHEKNFFTSEDFLLKNTFSAARAQIILKFN